MYSCMCTKYTRVNICWKAGWDLAPWLTVFCWIVFFLRKDKSIGKRPWCERCTENSNRHGFGLHTRPSIKCTQLHFKIIRAIIIIIHHTAHIQHSSALQVLNMVAEEIRFSSTHKQTSSCLFFFKVGLGISRTNADSQWNPVYNAFHRIFVVETNQFVGNSVNVILMRQTWTCGQRSSISAESKRRALENDFHEWICYMFLISKCREDWDPDWCTFLLLTNREQLRNGDFREKNVFRPQKKMEIGIAQQFAFRKYPKSAQT